MCLNLDALDKIPNFGAKKKFDDLINKVNPLHSGKDKSPAEKPVLETPRFETKVGANTSRVFNTAAAQQAHAASNPQQRPSSSSLSIPKV